MGFLAQAGVTLGIANLITGEFPGVGWIGGNGDHRHDCGESAGGTAGFSMGTGQGRGKPADLPRRLGKSERDGGTYRAT